MWCKHCRQDVPGLASPDEEGLLCARCGATIDADSFIPADASPPPAAASPGDEPAAGDGLEPYDPWEMDEQLRHIERVLARSKAPDQRCPPARQAEPARLDAAHHTTTSWHLPPAGSSVHTRPKNAAALSTALTWAALSLGTMALFCGGILLGWSMLTGREELWNVGLPIALGGQIALLVGLVMQLDRVFHASRDTSAQLHRVEGQIQQLNTVAAGAERQLSGNTLAVHGAEDPTAEHLLGDLKGRLDLLSPKSG